MRFPKCAGWAEDHSFHRAFGNKPGRRNFLSYFPPTPSGAHSHSIVRSDDNTLNTKRKTFLFTPKNRRSIRQKFALLISNRNFCASKSAGPQLRSASIGRFFAACLEDGAVSPTMKRPSGVLRPRRSRSSAALMLYGPARGNHGSRIVHSGSRHCLTRDASREF